MNGTTLKVLGFPESPIMAALLKIVNEELKDHNESELTNELSELAAHPAKFIEHPVYGTIAKELCKPSADEDVIELNNAPLQVNAYGADFIEAGAFSQMHNAARLPISVAAAVMPDAHQGYGLPIGGVLATKNAVIPYGVGVDIGCRMCLSIYEINPLLLEEKKAFFTRELGAATLFGSGAGFKNPTAHEVIDHKLFNEIPLLKNLQSKAAVQLGTSGSGNHFAEFGVVTITEYDPTVDLQPGTYLGFLTHSGSRGLGANIAAHYTKIAKETCKLPKEAVNLAWLSLDSEAGMEYWLAMNFAGDYASACHHVIHDKIAAQLKETPLKRIENHHNFAWKEILNGEEVIVHRKGATPAGKDVLGVIPGSMTAPGFIVKGKGEVNSIQSASHGAGRLMSRTKAMESITHAELKSILTDHGVTLIGGGLDEAPHAYKNIHEVMNAQQELVDVVGTFLPKIVKMDGGQQERGRKKRGNEE